MSIDPQYEAIQQGAAYLRIPPRSVIELRGADRATFLHNLCTQDICQCPCGSGRELFLTTVQGKTLGHGFAIVRDDSIWLVTPLVLAEILQRHLDRYLIREDVVLRNLSEQFIQLLLCGPRWSSAISACSTLQDVWSHVTTDISGVDVCLVRTAWWTMPNFMIMIAAEDESRVRSQLEGMGGIHCDDQWFDRLRIEAGFPEFGRDLTDRNLPQEVDRDAESISFTKGCYLGQETVARIDALGHVNWRMRRVRGLRDVPLAEGLEIESAGNLIARVGSCAQSPRGGERIGLAMIRSGYSTSGTRLDCQGHSITVEGRSPQESQRG